MKKYIHIPKRNMMKIIRVAYQDPHDPEDPMGHYEIPMIKDLVEGLVSGWGKQEMMDHFEECPRCMDNYLTLKNNYDETNKII